MTTPITPSASRYWSGDTPLTCVRRCQETHDTVTFEFSAPNEQLFRFLPGQFVSVGAPVEGKIHWRAYSISSSPLQPERMSLTIKRVLGGLVSNWMIGQCREGIQLPVLAPMGDFYLDPANLPDVVGLFSSGCGITPMMSMLRWLVLSSPRTPIHFFHSAHSDEDLIFADELKKLADAYPQLHVHVFISIPLSKVPTFNTYSGRLTSELLAELLPELSGFKAFLCGSVSYMTSVAAWLSSLGLPEEAIAQESFSPLPIAQHSAGQAVHTVSVPAYGQAIEAASGSLLLDVLEQNAVPIIGACRTGVCGSCKCKVVDGAVDLQPAVALTEDEVQAGYVLACSSVVVGDVNVELL